MKNCNADFQKKTLVSNREQKKNHKKHKHELRKKYKNIGKYASI